MLHCSHTSCRVPCVLVLELLLDKRVLADKNKYIQQVTQIGCTIGGTSSRRKLHRHNSLISSSLYLSLFCSATDCCYSCWLMDLRNRLSGVTSSLPYQHLMFYFLTLQNTIIIYTYKLNIDVWSGGTISHVSFTSEPTTFLWFLANWREQVFVILANYLLFVSIYTR